MFKILSKMDKSKLENLLKQYKNSEIGLDEVIEIFRRMPVENLGFANVDHHRSIRNGFPEVIFGQGKTPEHIEKISTSILERSSKLLITRTNRDAFDRIIKIFPNAVYHDVCNAITVRRDDNDSRIGKIAIVTAGTSDIPVAEEAAITADIMGSNVDRLYDVGVAGIHRVLNNIELLQQANVIVCVAGMEGALPSVVGGLVNAPVIAVPTSIGYGASFGGIAALLGMLNSCASNVTVVNIDNGFGAGYVASLINKKRN